MMREIESVKKKADMCQEFCLTNSMIQVIWKNRTKIIRVFVWDRSRIKQFHNPERSDIDEALLKWFKQDRSDSAPMRGPLLLISFALPKF